MKIDRLYSIMLYLMNHGRTSAAVLAEYLEVSVRTIQRDIDSLCLAGIPIAAVTGVSGGYELTDTFRMDRHVATDNDYSNILTALKGFASAVNDSKVRSTLEKITSLHPEEGSDIILDFSVLKECDENLLHKLQNAISKKRAVSFTYTNADNITATHTVEPIAVIYRWYSWYLLAYSIYKDDYRTYKLIRMDGLKITSRGFTKEHESAGTILQDNAQTDNRIYTEITVRCTENAKSRIIEYLNGRLIKEIQECAESVKAPEKSYLMTLRIVENEHLWFGTLLSLGDDVEILSPPDIRHRVTDAARRIISLYEYTC